MNTLPIAIISGPIYQAHNTGERHPENARRAEALRPLAAQLLTGDGRFVGIEPKPISLERIAAVHSARYVAALQEFCLGGGGRLDGDTLVSPASFEVARQAAGGLLEGVQAVMAGRAAQTFALVRPPGHHADRAGGMGFCLFNSLAIAAKYLLDEVGLERVLIVDWDVHHGNGTQDIFFEDERVLFFSTHESPLYPGTGRLSEVGLGRGRGSTVNLPLPAGCGDEVLEYAYDSLLQPLAERFKPQFVLVSAGYDGHWRDPLGHLNLSVAGYTRLTRQVQEIADTFCEGRLALTLEGGYDLDALVSATEATLLTLAGADQIETEAADRVGNGPGGYSPQAGPLRELLNEARHLHGI